MVNEDIELNKICKTINKLDQEIQALIVERARYLFQFSAENSNQKANQFPFFLDDYVLQEVMKRDCGLLDKSAMAGIFRSITAACFAFQDPIKVSVFAPMGMITQAAALKYFGRIEQIPAKIIEEVFSLVESKTVRFGIIPIENSAGGILNISLDAFVDSTVHICGEIKFETKLHLFRYLSDNLPIKRIYGDELSFVQSEKWLNQHYPEVERVIVNSDIHPAEIIQGQQGVAILSGDYCSDYVDLLKVAQGSDLPHSSSRFLIIGYEEPPPTGIDRTSMIVRVSNIPGALERLITPFSRENINLTMIKSRPAPKEPGAYIFFIDVDAHQQDENFKKIMKELSQQPVVIKILGSYPKAIL